MNIRLPVEQPAKPNNRYTWRDGFYRYGWFWCPIIAGVLWLGFVGGIAVVGGWWFG